MCELYTSLVMGGDLIGIAGIWAKLKTSRNTSPNTLCPQSAVPQSGEANSREYNGLTIETNGCNIVTYTGTNERGSIKIYDYRKVKSCELNIVTEKARFRISETRFFYVRPAGRTHPEGESPSTDPVRGIVS